MIVAAVFAWLAIGCYADRYANTHGLSWLSGAAFLWLGIPLFWSLWRDKRRQRQAALVNGFTEKSLEQQGSLRAYDQWKEALDKIAERGVDLVKDVDARARMITAVEADVLFNRNYLANIAAMPATPDEAKEAVANSEACLFYLKNIGGIREANALQQSLEANTADATSGSRPPGRL